MNSLFVNRIIRACKLDISLYEEVEADNSATLQAAGVVVLSTGAWFDPNYTLKTEVHGNPNVLTKDIGTSSLGQGPTSHTTLIEIKKANNDEIAEVTIFNSLNNKKNT